MVPTGTSAMDGASAWKIPVSDQIFWYLFSCSIRASRFSVCFCQLILTFNKLSQWRPNSRSQALSALLSLRLRQAQASVISRQPFQQYWQRNRCVENDGVISTVPSVRTVMGVPSNSGLYRQNFRVCVIPLLRPLNKEYSQYRYKKIQ